MSAIVIDGRKVAADTTNVLQEPLMLLKAHGIIPCFEVLLIGDNPASEIYVRNKVRLAEKVGIKANITRLPYDISNHHVRNKIEHINNDPGVHGILLQLPLPKHLNTNELIDTINPSKDIDGLHTYNAGKLFKGDITGLIPCTPLGCMKLIQLIKQNISGMKAVVLGRSNLVGKPVTQLLLQHNCTVTMLHSYSQNIPDEVRQADILIAAIGKPHYVKAEWIKPGSIVIDVGINQVGNSILGDVDFANAIKVAGYITPVPGGVGPMTVACLMLNTIKAAYIQHNIL
jgi:methylenetetrahydrofolate dehydrogenase (NADP+)/methenyltetrahydrofolate cyclohydrolase